MSDVLDPNDFAEFIFQMAATQAQVYRAGIVEGIKIARRQSAALDRGGNANVIQQAGAVQVLDGQSLRKEVTMVPED